MKWGGWGGYQGGGGFRWESLDPGDFVTLNSPTPGGNPQLCSTKFTIPLVGPGVYPWGKLMTCALSLLYFFNLLLFLGMGMCDNELEIKENKN